MPMVDRTKLDEQSDLSPEAGRDQGDEQCVGRDLLERMLDTLGEADDGEIEAKKRSRGGEAGDDRANRDRKHGGSGRAIAVTIRSPSGACLRGSHRRPGGRARRVPGAAGLQAPAGLQAAAPFRMPGAAVCPTRAAVC